MKSIAVDQKKIIKNFFIYAGGALFLRSVMVLIAPINMRILSPSDYGKLALINSFISISVAIIGLGLRQALSLEYFHCAGTQRKQLVNDIIFVYSLIIVPVFVVSIYFRNTLSRFVFLGHIPDSLVITSLVIVFLFFFVELFYQVLQYEQHAIRLTALQISVALLTAGGTILFLWYLQYGFASIFLAQLFGMSFALVLGVRTYLKQTYHALFDIASARKKMKGYLKLGLPFIPTILFGWILASGDRWILARYSTLHNVGIYAIADTLTQLFYFVVLYPWSGSYLPHILNTYAQNKDHLLSVEQKNQRVMYVSMIGAAILITAGYMVSKSILYYILPPNYHEAINYVWLLLMGQVFLLGSYFASSFIQFHKKSYFLALALCVPAAFNVVFNILLIPPFAIYGCVFATVLSYALYFGITLSYNRYLQKKIQ